MIMGFGPQRLWMRFYTLKVCLCRFSTLFNHEDAKEVQIRQKGTEALKGYHTVFGVELELGTALITGNLVHWSSRKQNFVALSSLEAVIASAIW